MSESLEKAVHLLQNSKHTVAFTGAGISVESGVPPFRGPEGLWSKYDPKVLDLGYFYSHPLESWRAIREIFYDFFLKAKPNPAHLTLARMEEKGLLSSVITQNIDNLHQEAGSKDVIEYHGTSGRIICPECKQIYLPGEINLNNLPPRCEKDGTVLKPDFIFFGEGIPEVARRRSTEEAIHADVFLLIGTTGEVMPAAMIPRLAKDNGAVIIEVNPSESFYTHEITDVFLKGKAGEIFTLLADRIL